MIAFLLAAAVAAAPPVTWQGRILDADGAPLQGTHPVTLRLVDAPSSGNVLWTQTYSMALDGGYGSAVLGEDPANPIEAADVDVAALYVEALVDGTAIGAPQRVGGSLLAGVAESLAHPGYLYGSTAEAQADGLLAYLDLDAPNGCEGSALDDRMDYLSATCSGTGIRAPGVVGMAIDRGTGVQNGVLVQFPNNDTYSTFTASYWWHPTSLTVHASGDAAGILWLSDNPSQNLLGFHGVSGPDRLTWGHFPNTSHTTNGNLHVTDVQMRPNHWFHFVVTRDATTDMSRLYLNGQILDEWPGKVLTLGPKATLANYFWLAGGNTNAHYGRGWSDEFALWDRALTPAEVAALYAGQRSGRQLTPY